jgi:nicotinamidase-related amidase
MNIRRSKRLINKHIHPYVLCIIDMQPHGFCNSNIIIENVLTLVREAIIKNAFIVIAQYKNAGSTHMSIINTLRDYPHKAYGWHNRNDKSPIIQGILREKKVFTRAIKVCGVNTEYCIWATVNGLAKKYYIPIKVIESACNGTDKIIEDALHHMRTTYKHVEVIS